MFPSPVCPGVPTGARLDYGALRNGWEPHVRRPFPGYGARISLSTNSAMLDRRSPMFKPALTFSRPARTAVTLLLGALLLSPFAAYAQQKAEDKAKAEAKAEAPKPPPAWHQGKGDKMKDS